MGSSEDILDHGRRIAELERKVAELDKRIGGSEPTGFAADSTAASSPPRSAPPTTRG
jgi:hypothetical protein